MTHAEAAARYPIREEFRGEWGALLGAAKRRVAEIGASVVPRDGGSEAGHAMVNGGIDGVIVPALDDAGVQTGITRWLGDVTLYYRPRQAVGAGA